MHACSRSIAPDRATSVSSCNAELPAQLDSAARSCLDACCSCARSLIGTCLLIQRPRGELDLEAVSYVPVSAATTQVVAEIAQEVYIETEEEEA